MKVIAGRFLGAPREGSSPAPLYRASRRAARVGRGTLLALAVTIGVALLAAPAGAKVVERYDETFPSGDSSFCTGESFFGTTHLRYENRLTEHADGTFTSSGWTTLTVRGTSEAGVRFVLRHRAVVRDGATTLYSVRITREGNELPNDDYVSVFVSDRGTVQSGCS